jgi:Flp pilus assembly protein TadD
MGATSGRVIVATFACLLWLNGCETSTRLGDMVQSKPDAPQAAPAADDPGVTGSVRPTASDAPAATTRTAQGNNDDLDIGKKQFSAGKFNLAERHFRRAVELHPRDAEAWLGLAASYDRLRKFELADRAYDQAIKIAGPTAEILNNRGYSYMLRGDPQRARQTLLEAQAQDPANTFVKNNLELLEASARKAKAHAQ